VSERPANDEMVLGFRDGYDRCAPKPSSNRSASYRHGFMCARIDLGMLSSPGHGALDILADAAMTADDNGIGALS
jgi:hypothetical protein